MTKSELIEMKEKEIEDAYENTDTFEDYVMERSMIDILYDALLENAQD